ncbi:MAG TPA: PH domain-containing protein [Streptosporangiaceae bacterium]|nr:PH domain-containing protein [Streptosporangiaceae bacterium]
MGTVPVGRKQRAEAAGGPQVFRSPTAIIVWWVWVLFAAANLIDLAVQGRDHTAVVAAAILVLATGVAYVTAQRPRIIADTSGVTVVNPLRDHHVGWAAVSNVDLADLLRVHCKTEGQDKVINSWAVHYSRRRKLAAENKARRAAGRSGRRPAFGTFGLENYGLARRDIGYGAVPGSETSSAAEADAERVARVLSEYVTSARAETVWAEGTVEIAGSPASVGPAASASAGAGAGAGAYAEAVPADARIGGWLEPLASTWSRTALLALLIPALILLVVALV